MYPNWQQPNNTPNGQPPSNWNTNNFANFQQPNHQTNNQPSFLSPNSQENNRLNRAMYSSTIEPSTFSNIPKPSFGGFGKLESMGRLIKEQADPFSRAQEAPTVVNNPPASTLSFRSDKNERSKMSSSVIFQKNSEQDLNRFPAFNINEQQRPLKGFNQFSANQTGQKLVFRQDGNAQETPEQKRKREILTIKQELDHINKKMEQTSLRKGSGDKLDGESNQPYFQLPTRKGVLNSSQSTTVLSGSSGSTSSSSSGSGPVFGNTQGVDSTMGFFQKYSGDTSKQQTTTNFQVSSSNNQPNLNKQAFTQPTQVSQQNYQGNTYNPPQQTYNSPQQIYKPPQQSYTPQTNYNHVQTSLTSGYQSPKDNEGGMFKKKKENPYVQEETTVGTDYTPKTFLLSPKGAPSPSTFKAENQNYLVVETSKTVEINKPVEVPKAAGITGGVGAKGLKRVDSFSKQKQPAQRNFKRSDFLVGKKMGKGQFGEVMLVQHKETGFLCGLKVMSKKQIRQEKYENQIARQLSIQFYLSHRNIAPLYGYFSDEENVYLLVEFCTDGQLLQMLRKSNRMDDSETSPIIRQICEGLDYIHKELIIHRDIKPENILFNMGTVKISDFGWAVYSGHGMRKTVSGSPLYYSPEIVMETEYDEKIDIWAIGMMTYECLLGKIPFRIYSQLDLNRIVQDEIKFPEYVDVSDEAKDFILKICRKKPQERMEIKAILRHPFITKHKEIRLAPECAQDFKRVLG